MIDQDDYVPLCDDDTIVMRVLFKSKSFPYRAGDIVRWHFDGSVTVFDFLQSATYYILTTGDGFVFGTDRIDDALHWCEEVHAAAHTVIDFPGTNIKPLDFPARNK